MRLFRQAIIASTLLILMAGCDYLPLGHTPIAEIIRSPGSFEGQEIKVTGTVTDIGKLPFLQSKIYILNDGSGEITVFTEGPLPAMQETVTIKAIVTTTAILGRQSFGLRLEEVKKLPTLRFGT